MRLPAFRGLLRSTACKHIKHKALRLLNGLLNTGTSNHLGALGLQPRHQIRPLQGRRRFTRAPIPYLAQIRAQGLLPCQAHSLKDSREVKALDNRIQRCR